MRMLMFVEDEELGFVARLYCVNRRVIAATLFLHALSEVVVASQRLAGYPS
jgi:hypothetical protein